MSFVDDPDDPGRTGFTELLAGLGRQSKKRRRGHNLWLIVLIVVGLLLLALLAAKVIGG